MRIFFSGYGWWFHDDKRSDNELPMVQNPDTPIIFPFYEHQEYDRRNPVRTTRYFYLEQTDKVAYLHLKTTTHIRRLYPCPDSNPESTFPELNYDLLIGTSGILSQDCIFIIDYNQSPEFVFPDDKNQQLQAIEPKEVANIERPKNKKSLGDTNLKRITSLSEFCVQLIIDKNGEKEIIKVINPKDQLPFHIPCTQDMILKALQNWSKKQGIKKHDRIWQSLGKGMDQNLWSSPERKAICTALKQGDKDIDVNFLKNYLP